MIKLFNINNYTINTGNFTGLHDEVVGDFEKKIAEFVGAKYACGFSSATNAIFMALRGKNTEITIPSIIPPVVANAIITSGNKVKFKDNIDWVGDSYILHEFEDYKIIDSAQKIVKNQFKEEANPEDLMIFSFYPTKPIGSFDGGLVVSSDRKKIEEFRIMVMNGTRLNKQSWNREILYPGFKMYLNSIQAFIANENFKKLETKYESLEKVRDFYNKEFNLNNTSYHLYRLNIENRDKLLKTAKKKGIEIGIHYKALHNNPVYMSHPGQKLKKSERVSLTTISIPFHENLEQNEMKRIVETIKEHEYYQ